MIRIQDMSMDETNAFSQLRRDFESYMKGEEPSVLELERAPVLESWWTVIASFGSGEEVSQRMLLVLVGSVAGHPKHPDGTSIHTSQLIWLDRNRRWARSWNRVYRLGARGNDDADTGHQKRR
jgi:hypothetical protein